MVADATSGRHGLRKAASRMRGSFENLANAPWLIRRSGGVQNAGEFAVRFLKFDAYMLGKNKNPGRRYHDYLRGTSTYFDCCRNDGHL